METRTETPKRLNCFFCTGDDHRIETEKESSKRGGERPEEDATIHRWIES